MDTDLSSIYSNSIHASARLHAIDLYLAALLAPAHARDDLIVVAAFKGELESIALKSREPHIGEIRLQWWRDWLDGLGRAVSTGHPIADALEDAINRYDFDRELISRMIDAQSAHLYGEGVASAVQFHGNLVEFDGAAFRLSMQVLGSPPTGDLVYATCCAGIAFGTARQIRALRAFASRGYWRLPPASGSKSSLPFDEIVFERSRHAERRASVEHAIVMARKELVQLEGLQTRLPATCAPALLPLALVEPYFKAFEKRRGDPLVMDLDISPLTRRTRLWLARLRVAK